MAEHSQPLASKSVVYAEAAHGVRGANADCRHATAGLRARGSRNARARGVLGAWLNARVDFDEDATETFSALHADYCAWMAAKGRRVFLSRKGFSDALLDYQIRASGRDAEGLKLRKGLRLRALPRSKPRRATGLADRLTAKLLRLLGLRRSAVAAAAPAPPATQPVAQAKAGR